MSVFSARSKTDFPQVLGSEQLLNSLQTMWFCCCTVLGKNLRLIPGGVTTQVKEFEYIRVWFTSEGKLELARQIGVKSVGVVVERSQLRGA